MKSAKPPQSITTSLLTLGLLMAISPAEENRYGYTAKPTATPPPASAPSLDPVTPAPAESSFWQRFRKDLRKTGQQLGKALNRTREELSYSYHTSTTEFPRNNNLNRHQKRFSGHIRTRNEARSTPYRKTPVTGQRKLAPSSTPPQSRNLKPTQNSTPPPRPPVEIVRPNTPPTPDLPQAAEQQPVHKPAAKQKDITKPPVTNNEKQPAGSTPPPSRQPAELNPPPKETVAEKNPEPKKKPDYPFATKTEKPGYVKSPYPPFALLDVRDIKPGGLAMEPDSDRIFRVPE